MSITSPQAVGSGGGGGLTAPVAWSDMTALTASRAVATDASGVVIVSAVTSTELGYLSGVTSALQTQINGKAAASHVHSGADITSGTVSYAYLGSGGGGATKFLREDNTWQTVSASPGGATTQIQFNNAGAFGGDSNFIWDNTGKVLGLGSTTSTSRRISIGLSGSVTTGIFMSVSVTSGNGFSYTNSAATSGSGVVSSLTGTTNTGQPFYGNQDSNNDVATYVALRSSNQTTSIRQIMRSDISSTGTVASGFGGSFYYRLQSSTTANQDAVKFNVIWDVATHASRTSAFVLQTVWNGGALYDTFYLSGNGDLYRIAYTTLTNSVSSYLDDITFKSSGTTVAGFGGVLTNVTLQRGAAGTNTQAYDCVVRWTNVGATYYSSLAMRLALAGGLANVFQIDTESAVADIYCDAFKLGATQVLKKSAIQTYGAPTGTLTRTTFDPSTVTLEQLAQRVAAMITDDQAHGFRGTT